MNADHERHRRSRPPSDGLALLARELGARDGVRVLRRLGGGLASATHLLALGDSRRVVLKRYPAESPTPPIEWEALSYAHAAGLPAPAPVALDEDGRWFGAPALVMVAVPGRADLRPSSVERYVADVADAMVRVHAASLTSLPRPLLREHHVDKWEWADGVPPGLLPADTAERAVAAVLAALPSAARGDAVLNHADFHPGNLVWQRGRLTGVIDWSAARVGFRWWEVAYFRNEAGVLLGMEAADAFLRRYEEVAGEKSEDQAVWDLLCLCDAHRWGHMWIGGYQEQGRRDLTLEKMRRGVAALVVRALRELE